MIKILNFGSCNLDYVYSLHHIVKVGETLSSDKLNVFPGGKGLNQSIALSRAGALVYHAGCIGNGGKLLTDLLEENNVDISNIRTVDEMNGHAVIQVSNDGDNSIFLHAGSNFMISKEHIDNVIENFSKGDVILLQNEINNLKYIIEKAYEREMCIVLNPSPINDEIFNIDFNMLSYIILNEVEAKDISGFEEPEQSLDYFRKNYPNLKVMLTLGKNGCIYQDNNESIFHPIFETKVCDTTAAGDTFTGYFVAGLYKGSNLKDILRIASCASAITVSRHGAAPSIPDIQEVIPALKTMKIKETDKKSERIKKSIDKYIDGNIRDVSLNDLANLLGYSTVYTGNLVKKLTGMSYKRYLQQKRLCVAAELIKNTELPIKDIIQKIGYENESYFRDKFKEKYKKMPLEYRKNKEKKL